MTGGTPGDADFGEPARFVEHLDNDELRLVEAGVGGQWLVSPSVGSASYRIKLLLRSGTNDIADIWILVDDGSPRWQEVLHLSGGSAARLVALMRNNAFDPSDGSAVVHGDPVLLPDARTLSAAYEDNPAALRALIESDTQAADVIAVAHRKEVVARFRRMLDDDAYFDAEVARQSATSPEGVWQEFFEANPWLLGLGLSAHLFVGWDHTRLEQVVAGSSVGGPGKRVDALMRTAGLVRLLAFAEIKHHRTDLLEKKEYRSGCFAPSKELSGAVAQSQGTVQLAQDALGSALKQQDDDGFDIPGADAYLFRPRSYVVAGQLSEFVSSAGGHKPAAIRSFELYRRHLQAPEVLTFDELLARAEAIVANPELLS